MGGEQIMVDRDTRCVTEVPAMKKYTVVDH